MPHPLGIYLSPTPRPWTYDVNRPLSVYRYVHSNPKLIDNRSTIISVTGYGYVVTPAEWSYDTVLEWVNPLRAQMYDQITRGSLCSPIWVLG